ncbi:MAG TPA: hypothetical protein VFK13_06160 [Gemmatimonadaceae bacterium]|nr:hypothetical protein [Gemmatimonadaceae bacterium]
MSALRTAALAAAVAAALIAVACGGGGDASRTETNATAADTLGLREVHPGDVVITTTNGEVSLGLVGDSVLMGLSEKALREIRESTDTTDLQTQSGFGAWIERKVKGAVRRGLSYHIAYPLDDVEDVRYENGAIRFDLRDEKTFSFDDVKVNDKQPVLEAFPPADAARFVAAVKARKSSQRTAQAAE